MGIWKSYIFNFTGFHRTWEDGDLRKASQPTKSCDSLIMIVMSYQKIEIDLCTTPMATKTGLRLTVRDLQP